LLFRFIAQRLLGVLPAAVLLGAAATAAEGPSVATDHVEARLVAAVDAAAPGETVLAGLHKIIVPHWHTYWRNPGNAGEPTQLTVLQPSGVEIGDFIWPVPQWIPVGGGVLVSYGYEGEVLLPFELTIPADAVPGDMVSLETEAYWLVCSEICIPEQATLTLDIPVAEADGLDTAWAPTLEEAVAAAPKLAGFDAGLEQAGDKVRLTVASPALAAAIQAKAIRDVRFFSFEGSDIVPEAEQVVSYGERGVELLLAPNFGLRDGFHPMGGVLAFEEMRGDGWARTGVEIAAAIGAADIGAIISTQNAAGPGGGAGGLISFVQAALFAFIGGLILNLMPCVFPVLSIKALGVINHAHGHRDIARAHGLAFLGGVVSTFAVLALALIALQAAGAQLGWGFQLQSSAFVTFVAVLFFAIGLNLLGFFEIGSSLQNVGGGVAATLTGPAGSFATGALAVLAASPCTAPFMSAALPVALSAPPAAALAIFLALGLGFAAPFTLLSFFPGWARLLPRPGAWMDRLKQLFAFPMFAAAVWLLWVLAAQSGPNGVLAALALMTAVAFAVWTFRATRDAKGATRGGFRIAGLAALVAVLALVGAAYGSGTLGATTVAAAGGGAGGVPLGAGEEAWSPERVAELRAEGKPVFVDFTAAWCITCQVNKLTTLKTARVQEAFAEADAAQLVADWTNRDPTIAAELERYDRAGVPLYLLFPPEGDAIVLNEILTEQHVLDALERMKDATS
jgi:thiol:disulfide interchange protein DsbD